jgi:hypothetical protein
MKRITIYLCGLLIGLVSMGYAGDGVRKFHGEISDSQCALNVHSTTHSHTEVLNSKGMGGTAANCATKCVKQMGGEFVLVAGKDVYRLDDQAAAEKFAGLKVDVSGTLDAKTKTIHVVTAELGK